MIPIIEQHRFHGIKNKEVNSLVTLTLILSREIILLPTPTPNIRPRPVTKRNNQNIGNLLAHQIPSFKTATSINQRRDPTESFGNELPIYTSPHIYETPFKNAAESKSALSTFLPGEEGLGNRPRTMPDSARTFIP